VSGKYPEFIKVFYILNRIASCSNITIKIKNTSHSLLLALLLMVGIRLVIIYGFIGNNYNVRIFFLKISKCY